MRTSLLNADFKRNKNAKNEQNLTGTENVSYERKYWTTYNEEKTIYGTWFLTSVDENRQMCWKHPNSNKRIA